MRALRPRFGGQSVIRLQVQHRVLLSLRGPSGLRPPLSGNGLQIRIGRKPMTHVDHELWILQDTRITTLQPVVPPAYRVLAPLDARAEVGIVRIRMVPRSDEGLHGRSDLFEHARNAVAIPVGKPADQKTRNLDFPQRAHGTPPKQSVALMFEVLE